MSRPAFLSVAQATLPDALGFAAKPVEGEGRPQPSQLETDQPVAVIRKNQREEIRIAISRFNGHDSVNIRVWTDARDGSAQRIPTKAGTAANVTLLPQLIEAPRKAQEQARGSGLLSRSALTPSESRDGYRPSSSKGDAP